jgi:REP-associated tyrosine transposase
LSGTFVQNLIHVVFSTRERQPMIPKEFQPRMWSYVAGICKNEKVFVHAIGGMDDHLHGLIQVPSSRALADVIMKIKCNSSRWASEQGRKFAWQKGYGAFSVSASNLPAVIRYIQNQGSYHKKMNFQREFIAMLKKHGVEYDPRYVFD